MKEIKAYIRPERVENVVNALRDAGLPHFTITHVRSAGTGVDPHQRRMSLETGGWYTEKAKLEFVCSAGEVDELVGLIQREGRTGEPGDGVVFVSDIERAVKIRTGQEGRSALR
ncbi:MAG: P-II family nitrogen regulator [Longimicrobiales bacterium]